jgi:stalled ribosome alternative rescue factor ArfA
MNDRIKPINPVARAVAYNRPRQQIVKPKKGKGSYDRKQINNNNTKGKNKYDFFI